MTKSNATVINWIFIKTWESPKDSKPHSYNDFRLIFFVFFFVKKKKDKTTKKVEKNTQKLKKKKIKK